LRLRKRKKKRRRTTAISTQHSAFSAGAECG
jgi:hypothetical protein